MWFAGLSSDNDRTPVRLPFVFPSPLRRLRLPILVLAAACALGVATAAAAVFLPQTTKPLSVKISKRPLANSRLATASFAWKKVSATRTQCKLDKKKFAKCGAAITYKKLLAGKHSFWVRVYHGTKHKTVKVAWVIDLTKPTAPVVTGGSASWVTTPTAVKASGSTDVGTGVAGYQYRESANGGLSWSAVSNGASVTVTTSGSSWVQFRARDKAGNLSPWAPVTRDAASSVLLDDTPPTLPVVTGGSANWVHSASVDVTASGSVDALSGPVSYEYRTSATNGTSWSGWAAGTDASVVNEGKTLVQFHALDTLGNASAPVQTSVWIDRTNPSDPTIAGGGSTWSNAASAKLTAAGSTDAGSGVAGYQYETSTDGGTTWSAPGSGASATISAEGKTMVQFQAIDKSGLTSNWVQSQVWLDRSAPSAPTLTGGSTGWQNVASVAITASGSADSGSGLAGYQYQTSTNGTTWSTLGSGATATINAEGQTFVRFRAVDNVGNASTPWVQAPAMIDRNAPTNPVISGVPSGWVKSSSVTVSAASTDSPGSGVSYYESELSIDNGATWSTPVAGPSVTITGEGQTLVQFHAVDNSGQVSGWTPATVSIDRTAPSSTNVTGGTGGGWVNTTPVTITGGGATDPLSGVASYQYRASTDGGQTWSAAATGTADVIAAQGTTTVQFRAIDNAGNVGPWSPSTAGGGNVAQIDTVKPTAPTVAGGSLTWSAAATRTISASGSTDALSGLPAGAGYESRTSTDGGTTWSAASAPGVGSLAVSAEGETLVQFRSIDAAGNVSAWVPATTGATDTVRLDHSAPSTPDVGGGSATWLNAASATVSASNSSDTGGSGFSKYQYRTSTDSGTTWSAAADGGSVAVTAEGTTQIEFRGVDVAGNASSWSVVSPSSTVSLDRTAPSLPSVAGGSASWSAAASVSVTASGSTDALSGVSGYQYETAFNGGAWSAMAAGASVSPSAEGTTTVRFRSIDAAGNTSAWTTVGPTSTVNLDRTVPSTPTVSGGSASWSNAASVPVTGSGATDPLSGIAGYQYETAFNGGAWSAVIAGATASPSAEGTTTVRFRSVDNAGNLSAWTTVGPTSTVNLDRTAPSAATASGGSLTWQNLASVSVTGSGETDPLSGIGSYQYRTSTDAGTTWSNPATGTTASISAEGQTLVQFRATDNAGNIGAWAPSPAVAASTVKLDRSVPTDPTVTGGSLSWSKAASTTISAVGSTDGGSGLAGYQSRTSTNGGSTWSAWSATGAGSLAVTATGSTVVQFRSVDVAGNFSAAAPATNGAANTVNQDRTAPTAPTVSGGSTTWKNLASTTVTATGGSDSGGSGLAGYQYQASFNAGAYSTPASGPSAVITAEGTTKVQFRTIDNAGNTSAWTTVSSASTVKLDRTAPTIPTVTGGSLTCTGSRIRIKASAGTDALSGLARYQYHYSTNGGAFGSTVSGTTASFTSAGTYVVQFQSVDNAGNVSAWAPATAGAANTACHS